MTQDVEVQIPVEVTVDESKFTPEFLAEFREQFYRSRRLTTISGISPSLPRQDESTCHASLKATGHRKSSALK
jgi:hypothetical protein